MLDSGAMFDTTSQSAGAVTASSYAAFMSGWSKHAYTRCASNVSRSEYRYTRPSAGSVNRCSPSPLRE